MLTEKIFENSGLDTSCCGRKTACWDLHAVDSVEDPLALVAQVKAIMVLVDGVKKIQKSSMTYYQQLSCRYKTFCMGWLGMHPLEYLYAKLADHLKIFYMRFFHLHGFPVLKYLLKVFNNSEKNIPIQGF